MFLNVGLLIKVITFAALMRLKVEARVCCKLSII